MEIRIYSDSEIRKGLYSATMFVISEEGSLFRRKPGCTSEYAKVGTLNNASAERREALLAAVRNANPERIQPQITGGVRKSTYANYKQARVILAEFNK
jgi:hypothetical protein